MRVYWGVGGKQDSKKTEGGKPSNTVSCVMFVVRL